MKTHGEDYVYEFSKGWTEGHGPLTKREYFAALAMQNLQNVLVRKSGHDLAAAMREAWEERDIPLIKLIARAAVDQADALIEELNFDGKR